MVHLKFTKHPGRIGHHIRAGGTYRSPEYETVAISFNGRKLKLLVADTFRKKFVGLMNCKRLGNNEGMLFVFDRNGRHGFWMLKMKISIDIIWLDEGWKIVHIWKMAKPCKSIFSCRTVKPDADARYVIELKAGASSRMHMKIGDRFDAGSW